MCSSDPLVLLALLLPVLLVLLVLALVLLVLVLVLLLLLLLPVLLLLHLILTTVSILCSKAGTVKEMDYHLQHDCERVFCCVLWPCVGVVGPRKQATKQRLGVWVLGRRWLVLEFTNRSILRAGSRAVVSEDLRQRCEYMITILNLILDVNVQV